MSTVNDTTASTAANVPQQCTLPSCAEALAALRREIDELKRLVFGQSRERQKKMPPIARELRGKTKPTAAEKAARHQAAQEKRAARAAKRRKLPSVDVPHDITTCPHCQSTSLVDINSPEISIEIDYVPAHFVQKRHIRTKKKCSGCAQIIVAPAPTRVTDGCHFGPALHAHAVVSKCADALPIHRLAARFARDGVPIERTTLNRLFHRVADLLSPIAQRILELVSQSARVHADETPILIQAPEKCRTGYVWTFLADKLIAYVFNASRAGKTPEDVLGGTKGYLNVDCYTGYNVVCVPDGRERVGCMAHIRRKFFNALKTAPTDAKEALERILSFYEVEYEAARQNILGTSKHLAMRRHLTKERMASMHTWMTERKPHHTPKSPMGQALRYALKAWRFMKAVTDDAQVRLDNNLAENALRTIALGRKNFLFVGDETGGENLATLQTIVSTCIASGVNPEVYIADVLLRLANTPSSQIDALLPANWTPLNNITTPSTD